MAYIFQFRPFSSVFLPNHLVCFAEDTATEVGTEALPQTEGIKELEEAKTKLKTQVELESLKNEVQATPETGIPLITEYLQNLNIGEQAEIREQVTPKTGFMEMIFLFLKMYFQKKGSTDVTGKTETPEDTQALAKEMFTENPSEKLDRLLVNHKCNSLGEIESALSKNKGFEFDVVWSKGSNEFVIQHNYVSSDQTNLLSCKEAYDLMGSEKGEAWSGDRCVVDLKDRMGMTVDIRSPEFQERAYQRVQDLLAGMPDNFRSKLCLATFDPYTEAMIWAYKSVAVQKGEKDAGGIRVMGNSVSTMSYGADANAMKGALSTLQGAAPGLVSAFQGFFNGGKDSANHVVHAMADRDGNGRSDTKIHTSYSDYSSNADKEANNIIATSDPLRARSEYVGGSEMLKKLIQNGLIISIDIDTTYLQHIVNNLDGEGRYFGVRPEDIVVSGVKNANELYDVLLIAHQKGYKWAAVIRDV